MARQLVVRGHGLLFEGDAFTRDGASYSWLNRSGAGHGKCSCGALSEELTSRAARQRWHRDHKLEVLAGLAADDEVLARGADSSD